jgi:putative ABC transport system substrate-binding protein
LGVSLGPKRLELLHEIARDATVIGHIVNPANPTSTDAQLTELQDAARALGLGLHSLHVSSDRDVEPAFSELVRLRANALVIGVDGFLLSRDRQFAALALQHRLPAVFQNREFAAAGGLMSYGGDQLDAFRPAGIYTGRILKGEKPADLPVQQAAKVELVINLKTAKALGLTVPLTLLGRADEVIE